MKSAMLNARRTAPATSLNTRIFTAISEKVFAHMSGETSNWVLIFASHITNDDTIMPTLPALNPLAKYNADLIFFL